MASDSEDDKKDYTTVVRSLTTRGNKNGSVTEFEEENSNSGGSVSSLYEEVTWSDSDDETKMVENKLEEAEDKMKGVEDGPNKAGENLEDKPKEREDEIKEPENKGKALEDELNETAKEDEMEKLVDKLKIVAVDELEEVADEQKELEDKMTEEEDEQKEARKESEDRDEIKKADSSMAADSDAECAVENEERVTHVSMATDVQKVQLEEENGHRVETKKHKEVQEVAENTVKGRRTRRTEKESKKVRSKVMPITIVVNTDDGKPQNFTIDVPTQSRVRKAFSSNAVKETNLDSKNRSDKIRSDHDIIGKSADHTSIGNEDKLLSNYDDDIIFVKKKKKSSKFSMKGYDGTVIKKISSKDGKGCSESSIAESAHKQKEPINYSGCLWSLGLFCFLASVTVAIGIGGGAVLYEYKHNRFDVYPPARSESLRRINTLSEQSQASMDRAQMRLVNLQEKMNNFSSLIQQMNVSTHIQFSELMTYFFSVTQELNASIQRVESNINFLSRIVSFYMEIQDSNISKFQQVNASVVEINSRLLRLQQEQLTLSARVRLLTSLNTNLSVMVDKFPSPISNFSEVLSTAVTLQQQLRLEFSKGFFDLASTFGAEVGNIGVISSCAALPLSSPSGYYVVRNPLNGSVARVYCGDMERRCGHVGGNWIKLVDFDMKDRNQRCHNSFKQKNYIYFGTTIRTCGRRLQTQYCSSAFFSARGNFYSRICGKITGFQFGLPNGFNNDGRRRRMNGINDPFVDGVIISRGNPREHIWTFALGLDNSRRSSTRPSACPCLGVPGTTGPPLFVGENYFCDSGSNFHTTPKFIHRHVWDGKGCASGNSCCSFNRPPFFYRQLPRRTSRFLEVRVCGDESNTNEEALMESVELYVQ